MSLVSLANASATQLRRKFHSRFSPFSPLVGWLATWWPSDDHGSATTDRFLVPDPDLFISPLINFPQPSTRTPHSPDASSVAWYDNDEDDDDDVSSEVCIPFGHSQRDGLTKDEFDYVVNSLLKFLEEAELASPESGCEEYEYYAPENTERRLRHGLWSPESSLYPMYDSDSEDEDGLSVAEMLESGEAYRRDDLELVRSGPPIPIQAGSLDGDERYPYHFEFEFEGGGSDNE